MNSAAEQRKITFVSDETCGIVIHLLRKRCSLILDRVRVYMLVVIKYWYCIQTLQGIHFFPQFYLNLILWTYFKKKSKRIMRTIVYLNSYANLYIDCLYRLIQLLIPIHISTFIIKLGFNWLIRLVKDSLKRNKNKQIMNIKTLI